MPGTPPNSPRLTIPRYANSDGFDFAGNVNAITDVVDLKAAKVTTRTLWTPSVTPPPTPFPSSPIAGDEHLFGWPAQGGRPAGYWRFRHNGTNWDIVGGVPMEVRYISGWKLSANLTWQGPVTASGGLAAWGSLYIPWTGPFKLTYGFTSMGGSVTQYMGMGRVGIDSAQWTLINNGTGLVTSDLYINSFSNASGGFTDEFDYSTSDGFGNGGPQNWTAGWRLRPVFQTSDFTAPFHRVRMSLIPLAGL